MTKLSTVPYIDVYAYEPGLIARLFIGGDPLEAAHAYGGKVTA